MKTETCPTCGHTPQPHRTPAEVGKAQTSQARRAGYDTAKAMLTQGLPVVPAILATAQIELRGRAAFAALLGVDPTDDHAFNRARTYYLRGAKSAVNENTSDKKPVFCLHATRKRVTYQKQGQ